MGRGSGGQWREGDCESCLAVVFCCVMVVGSLRCPLAAVMACDSIHFSLIDRTTGLVLPRHSKPTNIFPSTIFLHET